MKSPPSQPLYFVNAFVDFGMIGLFSILMWGLTFHFYGSREVVGIIAIASYLIWVVNHPHFMATNFRLYHSKENILQYPITALVIPWVILLFTFSALSSPDFVAPLYIKILLIWSPYHFSGQTIGICLLYARRAGFPVGRLERFTLSNFIYGTFLMSAARAEVALSASELVATNYFGIRQIRIGLPPIIWQVLAVWMALNGIAFLCLITVNCWQNNRKLPPIVFFPALTQFVWFVLGPGVNTFYQFVPFFHSLQYMLIAWAMQLKEKMDLKKIEPSRSYVAWESIRWFVITTIAGGVFFYAIPKGAHLFLANGSGTGPSYDFVYGVIIAAIQIHHFFVDGVIWKLKQKTVNSPLMVNFHELIHSPVRI